MVFTASTLPVIREGMSAFGLVPPVFLLAAFFTHLSTQGMNMLCKRLDENGQIHGYVQSELLSTG